MSRLDDCVKRAEHCSAYGQKKREECVEKRDIGYSQCTQERDDGYRDCCGWIPCKWFCRVWHWVKNIICVVWAWVKNIVCVLFRTFLEVVCVVLTIIFIPLCLFSPKAAAAIDRFIGGFIAFVDIVVGAAVSAGEGIVYAVTHPAETAGTIIEFFRGCPDDSGQPHDEMFVIAHHGFASLFPENTAQSCREAVKRGADSLEIDLCITSDGEVILWHDFDPDDVVSLARQSGIPSGSAFYPDVPTLTSPWRRPTSELTLAQFREHYTYKAGKDKADHLVDELNHGPRDLAIPTLDEFLKSDVMHKIRLLCLDVKLPAGAAAQLGPALTDRINAALPESRKYQVVIMVPSFSVLKAMKSHSDTHGLGLAFTWDVEFPAGPIINPQLFSAIDHAVNPDLHNSAASVGRPVGFFFPWKTYKATLRHDIRRWNKVNSNPGLYNASTRIDHLIAWTVNDEDELRCLVKMKVSGIITDEPRRLAELLGRKK